MQNSQLPLLASTTRLGLLSLCGCVAPMLSWLTQQLLFLASPDLPWCFEFSLRAEPVGDSLHYTRTAHAAQGKGHEQSPYATVSRLWV